MRQNRTNVIVPPIRNDTNGMGLLTMSERDLKQVEVLTNVLADRRTVESAAAVLELGVRQTFRLLARYEEGGGSALIHRARGRQSCFQQLLLESLVRLSNCEVIMKFHRTPLNFNNPLQGL